MYWASGCLHGPHHIMKEWADRYAGKFDDGWDAYRRRVFERAKDKGWIPPDCELTDRDERMKAWDDIPEDERPFQRRLMEVAAGFAEHCDVQVGRIVDELDRLGYGDNTLFLYIWGDNGSSAEGQDGTIAELLAQNGIPTTPRMHIDALEQLGGLDVLGSPKTDNQYHSGWGWAGSTPYKGVKLVASHLGGTRNPLAIRWPKKVAPDRVPRNHFLHVNDVVPTIYDIVGVEPPLLVNGVPQIPIAGASFARTLTDAPRREAKRPSTSRSWAVGPSITTAGWLRRSVRGCRGCPDCHPESKTGLPTTTVGSCITSTKTGHRPTTWPPRCPKNSPRCAKCSPSRPPETRCSRSAVACGCRSSTPSCASHRRTVSGSFPAKSRVCPSSARPRWVTRTTPSPSKPSCPPMPAASSMLSADLPAG